MHEKLNRVVKLILKNLFMVEILKVLIAINIVTILLYVLKLFGIDYNIITTLITIKISLSLVYVLILISRTRMNKEKQGKQLLFITLFTVLNSLILYLEVVHYLFVFFTVLSIHGLLVIGSYMEYEKEVFVEVFMKLKKEIEEGEK
jgi:hypothetical protein